MAKPLVISIAESRDGGAAHVFVFDRGPVIVGRDLGSSLVIDRDVVSGVHGVFEVAGNGAVTFCDLGSRNGTLLNGRLLSPDDAVALGKQDVLSIGNLCLQVLDERPETGFGPDAANPFAPGSSPGSSKSIPDETATVSPADVAAARAFGRLAKQAGTSPTEDRSVSSVPVDRNPILPPPPDDTTARATSVPTSVGNVAWQTVPEATPSTREGEVFARGVGLAGPRSDSATPSHHLPLADAGGTAIMGPDDDAALYRAPPRTDSLRNQPGSGTTRSRPGVRAPAQRGVARRSAKGPTVVSTASRPRRLAWVGIAAGAAVALAVTLGLVVARKREPAAASPAARGSEESREAPIRAVVPTPQGPADIEPHNALSTRAAPNNDQPASSTPTAEDASTNSTSISKAQHQAKRALPRTGDTPQPRKVGDVGIMP